MKYSLNDKIAHYNSLINPESASKDLELLRQLAPAKRLDSSWIRHPELFANKILYMLLDFASPEEISQHRQPDTTPEAKETKEDKPEIKEDKPEIKELKSENETLQEELEEKNNELEETKEALQEAEERADEAEERATQAEEELEAEKKKDQ